MSAANDDVRDAWGDLSVPTMRMLSGQSAVSRRLVKGAYVPVFTGLIIAAVLCIQGFMLWQARQEAWSRALHTGENVARTLSDSIAKNLEVVEVNVAGAQSVLESSDFDSLPQRQRDLLLFDRSVPADLLNVMLVVSRKGEVVLEVGGLAPSPVSLADRDYFLVHMRRDVGTYLSQPFRSRYRSGDPTLAMSRRVNGADGSFNGMVMAGVRLAYFRSLLDNVRLGPDSAVTLLSTTGTVLMRSPSSDGAGNVGAEVQHGGVLDRMLAYSDPFVDEGLLDGSQRLYVYQRVADFPLILAVGLATSDIYAEWNRQALTFGALTLAFCVALAFLVRGLQRGLVRSTEMEELLKKMSLTDVLTGLPNRRAFDDRLDSEVRRMAREGRPIALLLVDVDHFKAVNDTYGHLNGDRLLRTLGRQIQRSVGRPGDVAARFGGEEFAVLLPDTDLKGARYIAERIRSDVERCFMTLDSGQRLSATVSVGLVSAEPSGGENPHILVRQADEALYEAKAQGRNTVVWHEIPAAAATPADRTVLPLSPPAVSTQSPSAA
ncbi:sensor domain-containing diguanylate cyclase [Aquabacter cavernae]|uniref:sensor domain-containing diguanylate cyclase n=1 Tax=Aquabacter cavernae TaxID=2496029 RepID=UPI0013DED3F1|nr:sensor domain-containing diguanylate cyclase [Aquabacter cavernae]